MQTIGTRKVFIHTAPIVPQHLDEKFRGVILKVETRFSFRFQSDSKVFRT